MQLAPFLLILIMLALGAYALLTLRDNQRKLDALMAGPVRQAELATDLNSTIWAAHAKLYRLAATAANETDGSKILAMAREASAASAKIIDAVKALEDRSCGGSLTGERHQCYPRCLMLPCRQRDRRA